MSVLKVRSENRSIYNEVHVSECYKFWESIDEECHGVDISECEMINVEKRKDRAG